MSHAGASHWKMFSLSEPNPNFPCLQPGKHMHSWRGCGVGPCMMSWNRQANLFLGKGSVITNWPFVTWSHSRYVRQKRIVRARDRIGMRVGTTEPFVYNCDLNTLGKRQLRVKSSATLNFGWNWQVVVHSPRNYPS